MEIGWAWLYLAGGGVNLFVGLCLVELMFNVPINNKGHVRTLPPFYGTFTQNEDVMTSNKCLKYNHPIKPECLIVLDGWFGLNHFSWAGSNQSVYQ